MHSPTAANIICDLFLLLVLFDCTDRFIHGIVKQQESNERAELVNCQSQGHGWIKSCRHWQKIASNYQPYSMENSRGN